MRTTTRIAAVAFTAAMALSACSNEPELTAQQKWAQSLCTDLKPTVASVDPPDTTTGSPAEVQQQVTGFIQTLRDRLASQQKILTAAGAPPETTAKGYDAAQKSLSDGLTTLDEVLDRLNKTDSKDAADLQASLAATGDSLKNAASFRGPVSELMDSDPKLSKSISSVDECDALVS